MALVALQVHGENSTEGKPNGLTVHHDTPCLVPSEMDFTTAREISQLVEKKAAAVLAENYDEAKGLKLEIERLRLLGKKILELEQRSAVHNTFYKKSRSDSIKLLERVPKGQRLYFCQPQPESGGV